jgi:hypothetical protein
VRELVANGRYVVGQHAVERLDERHLLEWQVVQGLEDALLIRERLTTQPNPVIEVRQWLVDGTPIKVVWAHLKSVDVAKLVTVHYIED